MFLFYLSSLERKSLPAGRQVANCSQERQPGRCLNAKNPANVIWRIIFFLNATSFFLNLKEKTHGLVNTFAFVFMFHSLICRPDKISNLFLSQFLVKRITNHLVDKF